jgi:hypothetical protein
MKRTIAAGLIASLALAGGVAKAHDVEYETFLSVYEGSYSKGFAYALGAVGSKANPRCKQFRAIELRAVSKGGPHQVIDEATTSRRGYWHLAGPVDKGYSAIIVRVLRENIGPSGHKHICSGTTEVIEDFIEWKR